jgi:6-phosphogluconolactonase (cycloisomerase 2 family)
MDALADQKSTARRTELMHPRNFTFFILVSQALWCAMAVTGFAAPSPASAQQGPLTLVHSVPLPEIIGDFDHFAVDARRNHLFVSAEVHHSVEVFDLRTGEHLKSIDGFKTPHSLAFSPEKDELMVADGGDSSILTIAGEDYRHLDRVQLIDGSATGKGDSPDAAFYDSKDRLWYVGNGGVSANLADSTISIFSVAKGKLLEEKFDVPGNNVESMGIDRAHRRLYVNIRDKSEIGVFDLDSKRLLTTWTTPGLNRNTALAVDERNQRVFVAGRKPGMFYVFDQSGKVVSQVPCADNNDDMTYDPVMRRIYVSGTQGLSIFHQDTPDKYTEILRLPTNGAKTSILVPALKQFYAAHPKNVLDDAGLLVYHVNP